MKRHVDVLAPHAGSQSVDSVVRKFDGLAWRAERHRSEHRAKNFLLSNN
jgi:hypothetical protein